MEPVTLSQLTPSVAQTKAARTARRKVDGATTAAMLIQMASEILSASPTLRHRLNITLTDLAAADKIRKELTKKSNLLH